jgi:hypothetical protein
MEVDQNVNDEACCTSQNDNMHTRKNIYVKKPVQENKTAWTNLIKTRKKPKIKYKKYVQM